MVWEYLGKLNELKVSRQTGMEENQKTKVSQNVFYLEDWISKAEFS